MNDNTAALLSLLAQRGDVPSLKLLYDKEKQAAEVTIPNKPKPHQQEKAHQVIKHPPSN